MEQKSIQSRHNKCEMQFLLKNMGYYKKKIGYAWKLRLQISPIAAMSMSAAGSSAKQQESLEHCVQWQLTGIDMFRTAKKKNYT
ncbi:hypothetical protein BLOT_015835 [Blomia tropicalis]|nr:hypothetical protein BLOT_015835 [Blomia tropicalis]